MNPNYINKKKDQLNYKVECPHCQSTNAGFKGVRDFHCIECDELVKKDTVDFVLPYTVEQAETAEQIATIVLDNLLCGKYDSRYIGYDKVSGLFYSTSYFDDGGKILYAIDAKEADVMVMEYYKGDIVYASEHIASLIEMAM